MGAADGSIFTRHSLRAGGFEVSYLTGGYDGDVEPVLYLHGLGGGGKWESFHMALGTAALTFAPQLPGWQEGRAPDGIRSVKDYSGLVPSSSKLLKSAGSFWWGIPSVAGWAYTWPPPTRNWSLAWSWWRPWGWLCRRPRRRAWETWMRRRLPKQYSAGWA